MNSTKLAAASLGFALALTLGAGAGVASAAPAGPACTAATQQAGFAQASLAEATPTRNQLATRVTDQKAKRTQAINAGDVALVGQINVQLGSSTAGYNTMDSAVATAQARVVATKAAKNAAC